MLYQKFDLWEEYPEATLTSYVCEQDIKIAPRPAVIVCPGGGYTFLSPREAEPIVRKFFGEGMNVYLLNYSVKERAKDYAPLIEAAKAIKLVRERADIDNTDPKKIFILGFSAGGHLAASAGTLWNLPVVRDALGISSGDAPEGINRPDGMILCYPVISVGKYTHKSTAKYICGRDHMADITEEDIKKFSLNLNVDSTTPPTFLWHTAADELVPIQNSVMLISALVEAGVPFESHIFPYGHHGLSLASSETADGNESYLEPHTEIWPELAIKWIKECF